MAEYPEHEKLDTAEAEGVTRFIEWLPRYGHVAIVKPKRVGLLRRITDWLGLTTQQMESISQKPRIKDAE